MNRSGARTLRVVLAIVAVTAVLAACASPAPGTTTGAATLPAATGGPGTTALATAAATVGSGATTKPGPTKPQVDLVFSGTVAVTAKGEGGQCMIGTDSTDGAQRFGWVATERDFAGLGDSFQIDEQPGGTATDVKWAINQGTAFFGILDNGISYSADHHAITLDSELPKSGAATEHVKGTITCP